MEASQIPAQKALNLTHQALSEMLADAARAGADVRGVTMTPPPPTTAQKALTLHPKTAAGGIAFNVVVVVLYVLDTRWHVTPPPAVAAAITGVVTTICAWLAPRAPGGA